LRALEEDRSFRYAVMGLLGFKEVLERISRIEERIVKIEERQQRIEERITKIEERVTEIEERIIKLEERQQRIEERITEIEERIVKLEERFAKLEERQQRLEERQQVLEERMIKVEEELANFRRTMAVIAHRFGVMTEEAFREAMKYVVEDVLGVAEVRRWVYRDEEGVVYDHPSVVEVDLAIKDRKHILIEVKSRVSKGDVAELYRIGKLYEKVEGIKPELVILGGFIDRDAKYLAKELGVRIFPIIEV